jgi:hypothetical protein
MGTSAQTASEMTRDYSRASEDLLYEIQMIYLLRGYLADRVLDKAFQGRSDEGMPARNASIESFAIHVRNVIACLYNVKGRRSGDHPFADDYVTDTQAYRKARPKRPGSALDKAVVDRIQTQVVHLHYARGGYAPAPSSRTTPPARAGCRPRRPGRRGRGRASGRPEPPE